MRYYRNRFFLRRRFILLNIMRIILLFYIFLIRILRLNHFQFQILIQNNFNLKLQVILFLLHLINLHLKRAHFLLIIIIRLIRLPNILNLTIQLLLFLQQLLFKILNLLPIHLMYPCNFLHTIPLLFPQLLLRLINPSIKHIQVRIPHLRKQPSSILTLNAYLSQQLLYCRSINQLDLISHFLYIRLVC